MNSVRNGRDRNFFFFFARPKTGPYLTSDLGVPFADGIAELRHAEREDRHVEPGAGIGRVDSQLKQTVAIGAKLGIRLAEVFFEQWEWENIRAGGERRVSGENRSFPDLRDCLVEFLSLFDEHPDPFEQRQA